MKNKNVLVVGAAGLLGATLVKSLLERGARVVAVDLSTEHIQNKFKHIGVDCSDKNLQLRMLDLNDEVAVKSFFDVLGDVDGAVNCAYPRNKTYGQHFFDVTLASFNENLSLHLGSSFLFAQQCARYYVEHKTPFSLVNISSIYGVIAPRFDVYENTKMTMPVEYAAIKSALLHLNKYIISYVNESGFRINSVSPGGIYDHQPEQFCEAYKRYTHGAGMLDVSEIIGSILFLLSDDARYVTGQNIIVDDGFSL